MVGKWHMGSPGRIVRGFDAYYGYKSLDAHSNDQWDPAAYVRPARRASGLQPRVGRME